MTRALLVLLLTAAPLAATAQTSFGLKAGLNAANVSLSEEDFDETAAGVDKQARLGLVVGVTADVPITPSLVFRPEVLYTQKGYAYNFDVGPEVFGEAFNGKLTTKIDYLEVPLLLAYQIPASDGLVIALEAGPTLAYKLNVGIGCSGDFTDADCDTDGEDVGSGVRDYDIGGAIGATVGAGPFGVGLRYTNSITSIAKDDSGDTVDGFTARNQVLSVTGIYRFGQ